MAISYEEPRCSSGSGCAGVSSELVLYSYKALYSCRHFLVNSSRVIYSYLVASSYASQQHDAHEHRHQQPHGRHARLPIVLHRQRSRTPADAPSCTVANSPAANLIPRQQFSWVRTHLFTCIRSMTPVMGAGPLLTWQRRAPLTCPNAPKYVVFTIHMDKNVQLVISL